MFFHSIRFKITLWYMLILTVTLSLFSVLLYKAFNRSMHENMNELLQSRAQGIVDSIDTYWQTETLEAAKDGVNMESVSKINNMNFHKIAQRWVQEKSDDPKLMNIVIQIFDSQGNNIASSKNILTPSILSKRIMYAMRLRKIVFDDLKIESYQGKPLFLRCLTVPVVENDIVAYIVQVKSPFSQIHSALRSLQITLFLLLPLVVFLTGSIGSFLAGLTLKPVNTMAQTVKQITAENLKLRINIPDTNDEIAKLAETFNSMLEKLDKAFESQRQFTQDISHELRTPLTILKGELEVALKKNRPQENYASVLRSNLEEINRINRIVEDLLMLTKFDTKEIALKKETIDFNKLLTGIIDDIHILACQKGITVHFVSAESIFFKGDQIQLKRAVLNLLDNALKYTPKGGVISVEIKKNDTAVLIKVEDNGIGISDKDLPFVFDRFYRVDKSRHSEGYGMGLSIVKSIVEAHDGTIIVESKQAVGTAFSLRLPVTPQA